MKIILFIVGLAFFPVQVQWVGAAEYNGEDVDGQSYNATVYSNDTGNTYNAEVEFNGGEATLYFDNGGQRTLSLDDEEIDDSGDISATDDNTGSSFDLEVPELDE